MTIAKYITTAVFIAIGSAAPFALSGCEQESGVQQEMEQAGEQVRDAAEATGEAIEQGAEKAADEAEQAMEDTQE